jgi:hypothetical protein
MRRKSATGLMSISTTRSQRGSCKRAGAAALLLAGALILAGCSASTVADHLPTAAGGLPDGAPQRPAKPAAYPAVHDMPPARDNAVLSDEEQKKLEADLAAARNRLGAQSGAAGKPAASARNP